MPFLFLALLGGVACAGRPETSERISPAATTGPGATVPSIPTLYPTSTGIVPQQPTTAVGETRTPFPPTATPVDLKQAVVRAHLQIPAIGLNRQLSGGIGGSLTVEDLTTGARVVSANRGRALAEITGAFSSLSLAPIPDGCDRCASFSYQLPADGVSASGWLQDSILLASLDFFFTREIGPHFPPETVIGLHREPSGYTIGQTIAVLADGTLWRWLAPDAEIDPADQVSQEVLDQVDRLPFRFWEDAYLADCPFYPVETLLLVTTTERRTLRLKCPALALPITLVPFYRQVANLSAPLLADPRNLPFPEEALPLDGLVFYQRADGASLLLREDGRAEAEVGVNERRVGQEDPTVVAELAEALASSGVMPRGVQLSVSPGPADYEELLLVRGRLGVYELPWSDRVGQGLLAEVVTLENMLFNLVGPPRPAPTAPTQPVGTPGLAPTETPTATSP